MKIRRQAQESGIGQDDSEPRRYWRTGSGKGMSSDSMSRRESFSLVELIRIKQFMRVDMHNQCEVYFDAYWEIASQSGMIGKLVVRP